jgi:hypothetical protein
MYIVPPTTTGVHSTDPRYRDPSAALWCTHAAFSLPALLELICVSGE